MQLIPCKPPNVYRGSSVTSEGNGATGPIAFPIPNSRPGDFPATSDHSDQGIEQPANIHAIREVGPLGHLAAPNIDVPLFGRQTYSVQKDIALRFLTVASAILLSLIGARA